MENKFYVNERRSKVESISKGHLWFRLPGKNIFFLFSMLQVHILSTKIMI